MLFMDPGELNDPGGKSQMNISDFNPYPAHIPYLIHDPDLRAGSGRVAAPVVQSCAPGSTEHGAVCS